MRRVRLLAISFVMLVGAALALSVTPAAAWWQFVFNGPNGERQISPHFETEKECKSVLKVTEKELAKNIPPVSPGRKLRTIPLSYPKIRFGGADTPVSTVSPGFAAYDSAILGPSRCRFTVSCDFFALVRAPGLQLFSRLSHLRSGLP